MTTFECPNQWVISRFARSNFIQAFQIVHCLSLSRKIRNVIVNDIIKSVDFIISGKYENNIFILTYRQ
jgi:hypothetical protein